MEKLTKALMTDETGQAIVTKLTALSGQMHELAMATRGSAILFESASDISVLGDGGYLAVYVGSTNPLVISGWTGDNSLVTGHLYYLIKSGTAVASSDLGEYGGAVTDTTLSVSGAPADAKAVGDALADKADADDVMALDTRIIALEEGGGGITAAVKNALLALFRNVAYIGTDGQDLYDDLYDAFYDVTAIRLDNYSLAFTTIGGTAQITATTVPAGGTITWESSDISVATVDQTGLVTSVGYGSAVITAISGSASASCSITVSQATLSGISVVYTQSGTVYPTTALDTLKPDIVVTASWSDGTTSTVSSSMYVLSGTLSVGSSIVTVSYGGKTTTFRVTVSAVPTVSSISAVYTQSGTVEETDTLDSLKADLVVRAYYTDSSIVVVPANDYTLSGTLTVGTSTITASYSGKIATFNVTVSERSATLQSITATFTQGSVVIYTDSSLDDLKPHLVVTANYSDSTTATVTDYTLSGTLTEGTSVITVSYSGKTTTFNVTVTKRATPPVPGLLYSLPEATTFNGASDYIDTGVKLHENDIDYTITIDFSTEYNGTQRGTILHCMHEASPYDGFVIDTYAGNQYAVTGGEFRVAYSGQENRSPKKQVPYSEKIVITHVAGSNAYKYYRYNSNELYATGTLDYQFKSISESIWLGVYRTTTGTKGRYFNGTISDFAIYNYAWAEEEANAYIQEDNS